MSETNQDSWEQLAMVTNNFICHTLHNIVALFQTSPETSQALLSDAEQYAKLLSKTLNNDTTKAMKTKSNIGN